MLAARLSRVRLLVVAEEAAEELAVVDLAIRPTKVVAVDRDIVVAVGCSSPA